MKTLGLNMIVGANDALELDRCLTTMNASSVFDEIVIVATTNDSNVWNVASRHTTKVFHKNWTDKEHPYGDFGGARNIALEKSTTDYVMWLDADDVISPESLKVFPRLKLYVTANDFDFYFVPYDLHFDEYGQPSQTLLRERIFKRTKEIKWKYPVHEQLTLIPLKHKFANFTGFKIEHRPVKDARTSSARNFQILEHEIKNNGTDPNLRYCYARELLYAEEAEQKKTAIEIYKDIVNDRAGSPERMAQCCLNIALHLGYMQDMDTFQVVNDEGQIQKAETYARMCMGFSEKYAEPLVLLGDIYNKRGDGKEAIGFYKKAMQRKLDGWGVQNTVFYEEVPSLRLMNAYAKEGESELALWYSKLVLNHCPEDRDIKDFRKILLNKLIEGENDG